MAIDDFKDDSEQKTVLEIVNENVMAPLFSVPEQAMQVTSKTLEYVGSRSKIQIDRVKQLSNKLLDGRERDKSFGMLYSLYPF